MGAVSSPVQAAEGGESTDFTSWALHGTARCFGFWSFWVVFEVSTQNVDHFLRVLNRGGPAKHFHAFSDIRDCLKELQNDDAVRPSGDL